MQETQLDQSNIQEAVRPTTERGSRKEKEN